MYSRFFSSPKNHHICDDAGIESINNRLLSTSVKGYMHALSLGIVPKENLSEYDDGEIADSIKVLLSTVSRHFPVETPQSVNCDIHAIAHLLASLAIFKDTFKLVEEMRLLKLQSNGALAQIKAGMPGPCLIYMHTILESSVFDDITKKGIFESIIIDIEQSNYKFGVLGYSVLSFAIESWLSITQKLEMKINPNKIAKFEALKKITDEKYNKSATTFIDHCILRIWTLLDITQDRDPDHKESSSFSVKK